MPPDSLLPDIVLVEEARLDGNEENLVPIRWMLTLPDGGVAFSQEQVLGFVVVDVDGYRRFSFGRSGQGPGEFSALTTAGLRADTVWVYDFRLRRVTWIAPDGELTRTEPLPERVPPDGGASDIFGSITPIANPTSNAVAARAIPVDAPTTEIDAFIHVVSFDRDWHNPNVIAVIPRQQQVSLRSGGGQSIATVPFTRAPLIETSPGGEIIGHVAPVLLGSDVGTFTVLVLAATGDTLHERRYPFAGQVIPTAQRDSAMSAMIRRLRQTADVPTELARRLQREQVPEVYPPFTGIIVESDGTLWLQRRTEPGAPRGYLVLGPDGAPIGIATVPENVFIRTVAGPHVWGVERDQYGVESVIRFRR